MDSIEYYNKYAAKVYEDTVNQDMSEIIGEFLKELEEGDTILDLGCGSGRDSLAFYELGYDVTPLDASEEMCKLAEIHTGLEVLHMACEEMEFSEVFDGVFACGSLIHTPKKELPAALERIHNALKADGVLYLSFKLGDFEGFRGERYFSDYTKDAVEKAVLKSGLFRMIKVWETADVRSGHQDTTWVNVLARKI